MFNILEMSTRPIDRALHWAKEEGMNQSDLARRMGVLPQDITNWKKRDLPSEKYVDLADALNRSIDDLLGRSGYKSEITSKPPQTAPVEDVAVFDLLDVKVACGDGVYNHDYPEVVRSMAMPIDVAQQLIGSANKNSAIKIIVAAKDSMVPTINPDDLLFVDTSVQDYLGESIYILLHGNELVCKRLSLVGKHLTVTSDNRAYPSWPWDERPETTRIVGRVLRALPIAFKKFGLD